MSHLEITIKRLFLSLCLGASIGLVVVNVYTSNVTVSFNSSNMFSIREMGTQLFSRFHPQYKRREEVKNIDCRRLFSGDEQYVKDIGMNRTKMITTDNLNMSCEAIRKRIIGDFPNPFVNYSIAFARIVYKDYEFLEHQLAVSYSRENHFCFSIDAKSPPLTFRRKIALLASCLPNVYVSPEFLKIDSAGHNSNLAHLSCMDVLSQNGDWKYVMLLQNNDIVLHTNAELAEVYKVLNGSNDVQVQRMINGRINKTMKWDVDSLHLFNKETPLSKSERKEAQLEFAKGAMHASLTREAVEWMTQKVNITTLLKQLNSGKYGVDEFLLNTLHNSESLKMPGGFHSSCQKRKKTIPFFTRSEVWGKTGCNSGKLRHKLCIFGVEDLKQIDSKIRPHKLVANKMLPEFDFAAISCIAESIFNRTHFERPNIDRSDFAKSPVVLYQKLKSTPGFDQKKYNCTV